MFMYVMKKDSKNFSQQSWKNFSKTIDKKILNNILVIKLNEYVEQIERVIY